MIFSSSVSVISTSIDTEHPFSSVATTEYVPASKFARSSLASPFDQEQYPNKFYKFFLI